MNKKSEMIGLVIRLLLPGVAGVALVTLLIIGFSSNVFPVTSKIMICLGGSFAGGLLFYLANTTMGRYGMKISKKKLIIFYEIMILLAIGWIIYHIPDYFFAELTQRVGVSLGLMITGLYLLLAHDSYLFLTKPERQEYSEAAIAVLSFFYKIMVIFALGWMTYWGFYVELDRLVKLIVGMLLFIFVLLAYRVFSLDFLTKSE